jgi:hypothetical protein
MRKLLMTFVAVMALAGCVSEPAPLNDQQLMERTTELVNVLTQMGIKPIDAGLFAENTLVFMTTGGCPATLDRVKEVPPGGDVRSSERITSYYLEVHEDGAPLGMFKVTPGDVRVKDDPRVKPCLK